MTKSQPDISRQMNASLQTARPQVQQKTYAASGSKIM